MYERSRPATRGASTPAPDVQARAPEAALAAPPVPDGRAPGLSLEHALSTPVHAPAPAGGASRALPDPLRGKMERAFQQDFSQVRLRLSDEPSRLGARALTRGEQITVAPGHYRPDQAVGQELLGHELAHVVQQRGGRVPRGGGLLDSRALETEAQRQGMRAARGGVISSPAPSVGPMGALSALPVQPGWAWVDDGSGTPAKAQLKDNKDGTWTHGKTGNVYEDAGMTHPTSGEPMMSLVAPPTTTPPVTAPSTAPTFPPENVLFHLGQTGKINYLANTAADRTTGTGKYWEMDPASFAHFKNSGKRTESSKVFDPVSLKRYAYDEPGKQFYEWDKKVADRRGKAVSTTAGSGGSPSENQALLDRFGKGELVDRRRKDRSAMDLEPFDVGPYKTAVTMASDSDASVNRTYAPLSGTNAWMTGTDVNRDHIPSGESLNQRGDSDAYNQGFTITIPNPQMHIPFSPTYGSDNSPANGMEDDSGGTAVKRVMFDKDNPAAGAYRDMAFMLEQTQGQDYSASHPSLDLSQPNNRLRQVGGYRTLLHRNTQLSKRKGAKRGFDTGSLARNFKVEARKKKSKKVGKRDLLGRATYTSVAAKTQGDLFAQMIHEHLEGTGKSKLI